MKPSLCLTEAYLLPCISENFPSYELGRRCRNKQWHLKLKIPGIILLSFFFSNTLWCQTALTSGDIAVVGFNATDRKFAFVALKDIGNNTTIKFTDRGWTGSGFVDLTSEGTITWTTGSTVGAGTIVVITFNGTSNPTVSGFPNGTTSIAGWSTSIFGTNGDQMIVYQGTDASPTFIYGFSSSGADGSPSTTLDWHATATTNRDSRLPSGLLNSTNNNIATALAFSSSSFYRANNVYDAKYSGFSGTTRYTGTKEELLTKIGTRDNWFRSTSAQNMSAGGTYLPTSFTVLPSAPTLSSATSVTNIGFTVNWNAVTSATSYRLDVSTSDGFEAGTFVSDFNDRTVSGINQAVTGLSANTIYYYRVRAVNAAGTGDNSTTNSQTTYLGPGDIFFTTVNSDGNDDFSFVLLQNISAGTVIHFTDNAYNTATPNAWAASEGYLTWTASSAMLSGTQVALTLTASTSPAASTGTIVRTGTFSLFSTGDNIFAYQAASATSTPNTVTFLAGFNHQSNPAGSWTYNSGTATVTSSLPPSLTNGVSAMVTPYHSDNWKFDCSTSLTLPNLANSAKWITDDITAYSVPLVCSTPLSASITSSTNVTCNGGSNGAASVSASGGTPPYQYSWSPSGGTGSTASGLSAGTYTVTVTDAINATKTATVTITQATAIDLTSGSSSNVSCNGGSNGSASVTPSGGAGSYTYDWTPGNPSGDGTNSVSGLSAGTYTVTVTDAGSCVNTRTFSITQPLAFSISSAKSDVACYGGSTGAAVVSVSGATAPYTYSWAPSGGTGATTTGRSAGTYTVTITDAVGCTATRSFTITQPAAALTASAVATNASCFGGSNGTIDITPSGGTSPYTYNWGSGVTTQDRAGLTAGTYTLVVSDDNGCEVTVATSVTQPATPVSGTTVVTNVACFGGSNGAINLTPSGGTGPYTFNWGGGRTTEDRTGLTAGTYTVVITDNNGCTGTVVTSITQPVSITSTGTQTNVTSYNGSDGTAAVTPSGGTGEYSYDWTPGTPTGDGTDAVTGLTAGAWQVTITDANGCIASRSFTITQPSGSTITDHFRTNKSGTWSVAATWESSADGSTWIAATLSPNFNSNTIEIRNTHIVTVATDVTIDQTTVNGSIVVSPNTVVVVNDVANEDDITVNSGGSMILRSTAEGTGAIGNSTTATIAGNVTAERYLSGTLGSSRRNFFVASPVSATLSESWQQQIHITGPGTGGTPCTTTDASQPAKNSNGFDATQTNNPSMFTYNTDAAAGSRYTTIAGTGITLTPGLGYRVIVRGDRNEGCALLMDGSTTQSQVILSATGAIATGDKDQLVQGSGFTLLGNPYPSKINFGDATFLAVRGSAGIDNAYWVYDPSRTTGTGAANTYTSYSNGTVTNGSGTFTNPQVIAQGQAFFVRQSGGVDANVPAFWQEGYKTNTNQPGLFRTAAPAWKGFIRAGLKDANNGHLDEIVVRFIDEAGVSKDFNNQWDAISFGDATTSLAGLKGSSRLAIQTRPATFTEDVAPLRVTSSTPGNFKLSFTEINFAGTITLKDKFTNTLNDVKANPVYAFSITSDAASQGDNRFELVFGAAAILPVDFINITATRKTGGIEVNWKVPVENNIAAYQVERSQNGRNFNNLSGVTARGNSTTAVSYSWLDKRPLQGTGFYRIKASSLSGETKYSPVVKVAGDGKGSTLRFYPNPVKDVLNVLLASDVRGTYSVRVLDAKGVQVISQSNLDAANNVLKINAAALGKGVYTLEVISADGNRETARFIK